MTTITFLGGADTVTGSRFLVHSGGRSTLIDCGLFQGPKSVRKLNWQDPFFDVGLPDAVLLTHAHIDHTGYLPRLVGTHGFEGCPVSDVGQHRRSRPSRVSTVSTLYKEPEKQPDRSGESGQVSYQCHCQ